MSIYLSIYLYLYLYVYISMYLCMYLSIYLFVGRSQPFVDIYSPEDHYDQALQENIYLDKQTNI